VVLFQAVGHLLQALARFARLVATQLSQSVVVGFELILTVADEEDVASDFGFLVLAVGDGGFELLLALGGDMSAPVPVVLPSARPVTIRGREVVPVCSLVSRLRL